MIVAAIPTPEERIAQVKDKQAQVKKERLARAQRIREERAKSGLWVPIDEAFKRLDETRE